MPRTTDDPAIEQLIRELLDAWDRGDAEAYRMRYRADGTFTNVNDAFYVGHHEFVRCHAEILPGTSRVPRLLWSVKEPPLRDDRFRRDTAIEVVPPRLLLSREGGAGANSIPC